MPEGQQEGAGDTLGGVGEGEEESPGLIDRIRGLVAQEEEAGEDSGADRKPPEGEAETEGEETEAGAEGGSDELPSDVEELTDEQIAAIKDPQARKIVADLRRGFHRRMNRLTERERQAEARTAQLAWAERVNELWEQGDKQGAVRLLRSVQDQLQEQVGGPEPQVPGAGFTPEQLQELYENATPTERMLLQSMAALAQQNRTLESSLGQVRERVTTQDQEHAEKEIREKLTGLKATYGKQFRVDEREIVDYCNQHGMVDVEQAFKAMMFDGLLERSQRTTAARREAKSQIPQDEASTRPSQPTVPRTIAEIYAQVERAASQG